MASFPPTDQGAWITCQRRVAGHVEAIARERLARFVSLGPEQSDYVAAGATRLWFCIEHHWKRLAGSGRMSFENVILQLEKGRFGFTTSPYDVLEELAMAQMLEAGSSEAAALFEQRYMPAVRAFAVRAGSTDDHMVENFAAELVLPRESKPPRIRSFQGRTPFTMWLRAVVANFVVSRRRRSGRESHSVVDEPPAPVERGESLDRAPCERLLGPILHQTIAAIGTESRLLLQMLILDAVPQRALAVSLGIDPGTLTRRRQKAARQVFARFHELATEIGHDRQARECLELVISGDDVELRQRLAELLAGGIKSGAADKGVAL